MAKAAEAVIAQVERAPRARRRHIPLQLKGAAMMAPALVFLFAFVFVPMGYAVYLSLYQSTLYTPRPVFAGLANYAHLFTAPDFWQAAANTLWLAAGMMFVSLPIALLLAVLLNQRIRGRVVFRAAIFGPYVMPLVSSGLIFSLLFATDGGPVNLMLAHLGLNPVPWLGEGRTALVSVLILTAWQFTGYYAIIFLAGLQSVPPSLVEACQVDGGGRWQVFWHVTLRALGPSLFFAVVICLIQTFQTFDQVYVMTGGGPDGATTTFAYYIFEKGFQAFNTGESSAASVILILVLAGLSYLQMRVGRHFGVEES
ncbi:carbohydrate ABC transporter permease [Alicyclobacillus vulcanalis]|uniref:Carbohydrate ABC transporter membrane protein 1, CUT1 family n=1 Tax=Alicyclobacillus vulcanalis TaxID=252246 RepID=A0A1N7MDS3_9BACL|nr:sugar ABC transporter permease [Alicyclobacillus vulcanalis]SIS84178.1 carbohydrate ABC transporter membrane protein 1, CUT1 family [Alicyclobacillus vulcanalis]